MPTSRTAEAAATAVDRVAAAVRADILSGVLAPGEPLREEAAAIRYDVSRHTVRAAFQRLVGERLAVAETFRGVRVASFGRDEVIALQQLRAALEVEAVRIAGERFGHDWPDAALAPARAAIDRLDALAVDSAATRADDVDWLEVERVHADFHRALVATSDSPRIIEAHAALGSELLLFLLHVRPHYTLDTLIEEHRALLDALPTRGGDAVREHLEHSTRLLIDA
ncbi:GntR family transcriptional regulator [Agromyces sp. SYSU K20354]|uniref:GntR family transcriptional regulator n=1 Tax=Agromyces cavernae TaxID=2898659 RepID=UPI001E5E4B29|nr:GntR family transcriptional regulator [Agromyces cavernae]MCD2440676.1 GntR family transcriptional regulator [Agromyces cavernae]